MKQKLIPEITQIFQLIVISGLKFDKNMFTRKYLVLKSISLFVLQENQTISRVVDFHAKITFFGKTTTTLSHLWECCVIVEKFSWPHN